MDSSTTYVPQSQVWVSGTPSMLCFLESDWKCYIWHWNGKRKEIKKQQKETNVFKMFFFFYSKNPATTSIKVNLLIESVQRQVASKLLDRIHLKEWVLWWRKQYLRANLLVTLISYLPLYLLQVPKYDESYLSDDTRALAYLGLLEAVSRPQRGLSTTCTSWEQA